MLNILFEDTELLVLNKPAGLPCHPTKEDVYSSLISRVRLHLGPDVTPHLVNRLDRETSGVTLVAKTRKAAVELRRIWEERRVRKVYLAIVHGWPHPGAGLVEAPLGRDAASPIAIKDCVRDDGAPARTAYEVQVRFERAEGKFALLQVTPESGRKHQIRIHLQHIGHPIVGDKLYGGDELLYLAFVKRALTEEGKGRLILPFQALHAAELGFRWREAQARFRAEPEPWFSGFLPGRDSSGADRDSGQAAVPG